MSHRSSYRYCTIEIVQEREFFLAIVWLEEPVVKTAPLLDLMMILAEFEIRK